MRKPMLLLTVVALVLGLVAAPLGATTTDRPTFRKEQVYFKCTGTTKVYQVNWLAALGNASTYTRWDTTPPSGSVTDGAGCGATDLGGTTNLFYNPVFDGYFQGNLRDMTVQLHHLLLSQARSGEELGISIHLEIDGQPLFPPGPTQGGKLMVKPVRSETGASELFEFSITNLGYVEDILDDDGNVIGTRTGGLAREAGDGKREYHVRLLVGLTEYPKPGAWVWDTTEVPSGIVFNPDELAPAKIRASLPQ